MSDRQDVVVFAGRAADHNDRAMIAVQEVGVELGLRLGVVPTVIGRPEPATNHGWFSELSAALPELRLLAGEVDAVWSAGRRPVLALSRNTAALATLPVLARHHPGAVMVWIGADGSLNIPTTTRTGYLGGMVLSAVTGLWDSALGAGLPLSHVAMCGTRDLEPMEQLLLESGVLGHVLRPHEPFSALEQMIDDRPIFVHFACDVLEPGIVQTDYTIAGGFTLDQLKSLAELLARHDVLGLQITELEVDGDEPEGRSASLILDALWPLVLACRSNESVARDVSSVVRIDT